VTVAERKMTERDFESRTTYPVTDQATTDGLFIIQIRRIKSFVVSDSRGGERIKFTFKNHPDEETP